MRQLFRVALVSSCAIMAIMIAPFAGPAVSATGTGSHDSQATLVPPTGFNPLTASTAQLTEYGFPPRPTSGQAYASWATAMKHALHYVPPAGGYGSEGTTSGNWGGYYELESDNGGTAYEDANGTLAVPSCSETSGASDEQTVAWVGMDGVGGSSDVFQAGVACTPGASTTNKIDNATYPYQFWWEDYPSAPYFFTSLIPSSGDTVYIDVNSQGDSVYIEDETDNDYSISKSVSLSNFSGDSVEWVTEGYSSNWADFGTVDFNDPAFEYSGGGGGNFSPFNYWETDGEKSGSAVVACPRGVQSGPPAWYSVSWTSTGSCP